MKWTHEELLTLIKLFQDFEHLYNVKHTWYYNRIKREEALTNIRTILSERKPGITTNDVKSKIKILRTQYTTEKNKIKSSKRSGAEAEAGADNVFDCTPKLWCYKELSFLQPYTESRSASSATPKYKKPNNFGASTVTSCKVIKSVGGPIKTKNSPDHTLGPYLAYEINKVTCPELLQELTMKLHLLIGEYVKKQNEKNQKIWDEEIMKHVPSDDDDF